MTFVFFVDKLYLTQGAVDPGRVPRQVSPLPWQFRYLYNYHNAAISIYGLIYFSILDKPEMIYIRFITCILEIILFRNSELNTF